MFQDALYKFITSMQKTSAQLRTDTAPQSTLVVLCALFQKVLADEPLHHAGSLVGSTWGCLP